MWGFIAYTLPHTTHLEADQFHMVLEPPLFALVGALAKKEGVSLSEQARDLIREAVELREDRALDLLARDRRKTFDRRKALSLADLRKGLRAR